MEFRIIPTSDGKIRYSQFKALLEFLYLKFPVVRIKKYECGNTWVIEVETEPVKEVKHKK